MGIRRKCEPGVEALAGSWVLGEAIMASSAEARMGMRMVLTGLCAGPGGDEDFQAKERAQTAQRSTVHWAQSPTCRE